MYFFYGAIWGSAINRSAELVQFYKAADFNEKLGKLSFHQIFALSPEDLISTFRVQRYQDACWQVSTGYQTAKQELQNAFHGSKRSAVFFNTLASLKGRKTFTCSVDRIKNRTRTIHLHNHVRTQTSIGYAYFEAGKAKRICRKCKEMTQTAVMPS